MLDVAYQTAIFWDGRRSSLADQATDPLFNPLEHGLSGEAELLAKIRADHALTEAFRTAYGVSRDEITVAQLRIALAAFQRTLVSPPAPVDRFLAGETLAMPESARRGWQLFSGQAQCIRCHRSEGAKPLFTDHGFHALGVGLAGIERDLPRLTARLVAIQREGAGRSAALDHAVLSDPAMAELGRFAVTLDPADIGKFKTPVLRNVALTAPYMHDGSVATLAEAVDLELYYRGAQDGRPLILTPRERDDLLAFLHALTSDGLSVAPADSPR